MNELEGLSNMGVWDIVDKGVCYQKTGKPPIRGRWVDVNKGEDKSPVYRSRYVAQELRRQHGGNTRERLFAAMPPLEAIKALISDVATHRGQGRDPRKLLFVDISKAYLHTPVMRNDIYVELLAEMEQPGRCGRLQGAVWDKGGSEVLGARVCSHARVHRVSTWIHFTVCFLAQGQRTPARRARG